MGQCLLMLCLSVDAHPLGISISKKQLEIKQQLGKKHTVSTHRLKEINSAPPCLSVSTEHKYLVHKLIENIYVKVSVKAPQGSVYELFFIHLRSSDLVNKGIVIHCKTNFSIYVAVDW